MERLSPACKPNFRWMLLCILPAIVILCLAMLAPAAPASAATLYPCQPPYSNSGYYPDLSWGYDVDHAFSTDGGPWYIYVYESGLSQQTQYRTAIYDSNGKYLTYITGITTVDGSCLGGFSLLGDYHLQAGYADAVKGEPWHIAVYDMQSPVDLSQTTYGSGIVSVPVYVNYNGVGGGGGGGATLQSIEVNPDFIQMEVRGNSSTGTYYPTTQQLTVTAYWSDGSTSDVTSQASYTGYDTTVATISSSGLVTAGTVPNTNTTATVSYDGSSEPVWIDVYPAKVISISAAPPSVTLYIGQTKQLTVTADLDNGSTEDITSGSNFIFSDTSTTDDGIAELSPPNQPVVYYPNENNGGMISTAFDHSNTGVGSSPFMQRISLAVAIPEENGCSLVTGEAVGTTQIEISYVDYFYGGTYYATPVPVTVTNPVISIAVKPLSVTLDVKGTQQLTVTATMYDATTSDVTSSASYTGYDSSIATVSSNGLVTGLAVGGTNIDISYTDSAGNTVTATPVPVTVESAPVQTYTVTYYGNGGTGSVPTDNTAYTAGEQVIVKDAGDLARTDYTFIGWNTQEGGSGTNYKAGDTFTIEADTKLYAVWSGGHDGVESFPILPAKPSYFEQL